MAPVAFDLAGPALGPAASPSPALQPGTTKVPGIAVTHWRNEAGPAVNGHPVPLAPEELARSAAVIAAAHEALIGTDGHLILTDDAAHVLATVALPAAAWGVVPSGDGRFAVVALGDGTMRWYALGAPHPLSERLALFGTPEGHDWIAWTEDGHFAHGETGGADLAGYQINRSAREAPRWVAFSQLYQLYYAPDVIRLRLLPETAGQPEPVTAAVEALRQKAPPGIDLVEYCLDDQAGAPCRPITPNVTRGFVQVAKVTGTAGPAPPPLVFTSTLPAGAVKVRLRYRVTARSGGVGDIDLFVNGRVVSNTRGFVQVGGTGPAPASPAPAPAPDTGIAEVTVTLEPGRNLLHLRAYDESNAIEERSPAIELLAPAGTEAHEAGGPVARPDLYVLGVGIDQYAPPNRLRFAVKDMSDVVATIKAHASPLYGKFVPVILTDQQATLSALGHALDDLASKVTDRDTVIIYLAGHGFIDDSAPTKPYYFITDDVDPARVAATSASQGFLKEKLTRIKSKNVFLFLDTCHAGALAPETFDRVHNYFGQIYILAAASPEQQALDAYKNTNGPFAYAVIEGLNGGAARDGVVDDHALGTYVKHELPRLVDEIKPGYRQSASFKMAGGEIEDFPLTEIKP